MIPAQDSQRSRFRTPFLAMCALFASVAQVQADDFDLTWHTIDGGGHMFSTNGPWSLGGTIGQSDAGAPMTGGGWELTGGFWPGASPPLPPCPGDVDGNFVVDLTDLSTLLAHFGTPSGATLADGDLDGDGDVDLSDLAALLGQFGTRC